MAIDLFDTRTMLAMLSQMLPAKTFLADTFFNNVEVSDTKYVDIDIQKGKRRLAPFVNPNHQGKMVERIGYTTKTYEPPYVKPKMITTAGEALKRGPGENVYGAGKTAMDKAEEMLVKDLADLENQIARREEWMIAQLLQTGACPIVGDGVNTTIDFGIAASHLITLLTTARWSEASATPLEDLRAWRKLIMKDSGLTPNVCVMGSDALNSFLAHASVTGQLDTRRIDLGIIDPVTFPNGAIYYGRIKDVALDLWVYDEWYIDDSSGVETPMLDTKKVILGSTQARTAKHYGAIQDLDFGGDVSVSRFPKTWTEKDPSRRILMLQSAPLPSLHQVDAFICATVQS